MNTLRGRQPGQPTDKRGRKGNKPTARAEKTPARNGRRHIHKTDAAAQLERELKLHAQARRELKEARDKARREALECQEAKERFEAAFRAARIHAFAQDRDLRYTWVTSPSEDESVARLLGRTDDELWSSPEQQAVTAVKRRVLATGKSEDCEVSYITPESRALYSLHIDPVFAHNGSVKGLICAAIDITRIRSLESEQRRLAEDLATAVQRYEFGLRGSNIAVFTQDKDLRYTSVSKPMFGRDIADLRGRTDQEVLPPGRAFAVIALKRAVLEKGIPLSAELRIDGDDGVTWYDFHVEPMRDVSGSLTGLTGTAVNITERKEAEAHLRLLMRELTHRSKNLLAVIQAMARQTARHTGNITAFLERFSARVQALARSHDLLVAESWHGASLNDLVRSQLAHYLDRESDQVLIDGPEIQLKPEATQSLGLALHELATNAAKHGALSKSDGRVHVTWQYLGDNGGIELVWRESKGPKVSAPKRRGFGSMVIEHNLARALDAEVCLDFSAEGLTCRVAVPQTQLAMRS